MLAALFVLAKEGDAQLALARNTGRVAKDDEDLTSEQWEAKFKFLDTFGKVYGAQSRAAKAYPAVKLTTLRSRYEQRNSGPSRRGPPPRMDERLEKHLVDWITYANDKGFPVTNAQLCTEAKSVAFIAGGFAGRDSVGGKTWRKAFQRRHPEIQRKNSTLMERVRKMSLTKEGVERYFDLAEIAMTGCRPEFTFFADETYIDMHPRMGVQVCPHTFTRTPLCAHFIG